MDLGDFELPKDKEPDAQSVGKLSILSEHSEEEYQRTIQSLHAQKDLLSQLEKIRNNEKVRIVNEENSGFDVDGEEHHN